MLASLCALLLLNGSAQAPERVKTALDNGMTVLAERRHEAKSFAATLFVASRGEDETAETHGLRHLLEHLLAKGPDGKVDLGLESRGMVLSASTLRDATSFEISGPLNELDEALRTLRLFAQPPTFSQAEIRQEVQIIAEEQALEPKDRAFSKAGWQALFGPSGLDPSGSVPVLAKATPQALSELHKRLFRAAHLVMVVRSSLSPEEAGRKVSAHFSNLPNSEPAPWQSRTPAQSGEAEVTATGQAVAAAVPSLSDPRTAWALAAGLALASELESAFLTYTPSIRPGALIVGSLDQNEPVSSMLAALSEPQRAALMAKGKDLAKRWCRWRIRDPEASAYWTGYLLAQGWGASIEALESNLDVMTAEQFLRGFAMFDAGVKLVGKPKPLMPSTSPGAPIKRSAWGNAEPAVKPAAKRQAIIRPDPTSPDLCVEAIVPLTGIGDLTPGDAEVLAECLLLGNGAYSRRQIRETCSQTGVPPRVEAMPDHIRISLRFPPGRLRDAVPMLSAMLRNGEFAPASVTEARALTAQPTGVWERALVATDPGKEAPDAKRLEDIYRAAFRPERVVVLFGGAVDGIEAARLWQEKVEAWQPSVLVPLKSSRNSWTAWPNHATGVATLEWRGPEFPAWDAALSTRLVAISALGFGKGSSAYQLIREKLGWSYRQEAFLWPSPFGFQPRIIAASSRLPDSDGVAKAKQDLLAAVRSWTEQDLVRAKGIVRSAVELGTADPPIVLSMTGPLRSGASDRLFEEGYWIAKTGAAIDRTRLLARIDLVPLQDIKDMASEWLEKAETIVIRKARER